jgi:TPR repeat protein
MRIPRSLWCLTLAGSTLCYAQGKRACELLTSADVESVLGTTLEPTRPFKPFRSFFDDGRATADQGCSFTNFANNKPKPARRVDVTLQVRYSAAPDAATVEAAQKWVDENTYYNPVEVPGLGDAAFWIGAPHNVALFVFKGGTTAIEIGPNDLTLEEEKALAAKALGGTGKTGFLYSGRRVSFSKPALANLGAKAASADQLKSDLGAKAEAGDSKAQFALGNLYQFGTQGADGGAKPDYAAAGYWYQQASDRGHAQACYALGIMYRDGLGLPANPIAALEMFRKAALAGYVPAMVPLSFAYAAAKTDVSGQRATYWAQKAAESGDAAGWLIIGYGYNKGMLGGEPPYWYRQAMNAYTKAANGGNCVAMMNIGGLYFNGDGVPQDKNQAQSWFAKADACAGKDLEWVRETSAKYQARVAGGRLPAPRVQPQGRPSQPNGGRLTNDDAKNIFTGLMALLAWAMAEEAAHPSQNVDNSGALSDPLLEMRNRERQRTENCIIRKWGALRLLLTIALE